MCLIVKQVIWLKVCLYFVGLLLFFWLVWVINYGGLGVDLVKDIQYFIGCIVLKFLLVILLIIFLVCYVKQLLLICICCLLGLWCFVWVILYLISYVLLELGVNNLVLLGKELIIRFYLMLGIISWVILFVLVFILIQVMQ